MSKSKRDKCLKSLSTAAVNDRLKIAEKGILVAQSDISQAANLIAQLTEKYLRRCEDFGLEGISGPPHRLELADNAKAYNIGRWSATFGEIGLGTFNCWFYLNIHPVISIPLMIFLVVTAHSVWVAVLRREGIPVKVSLKFNDVATIISASEFFVALGIVFIVRCLPGTLLATWLIPFFNLSVWLLSISLLQVSFCLYAKYWILSWSVWAEAEYKQAIEEKLDAEIALAEFEKVVAKYRPPTDQVPSFQMNSQHNDEFASEYTISSKVKDSPTNSLPIDLEPVKTAAVKTGRGLPRNGNSAGSTTSKTLLLLFAMLFSLASLTGCQKTSGETGDTTPFPTVPAVPETQPSDTKVTLQLVLDVSESVDLDVTERYLDEVSNDFPLFIEKNHISRVEVLTLCTDGTRLKKIIELVDFPAEPQKAEPSDFSKASELENVRKSLEAEERQKIEKNYEAALNEYRTGIKERAKGINGRLLNNAERGKVNECSDVGGLYRSLAKYKSNSECYVIFVTDGIHCCSGSSFPDGLPTPSGKLSICTILVPSKTDANGRTATNMDERGRKISAALPWANVTDVSSKKPLTQMFEIPDPVPQPL